jgi:hypothetical protein
MNWSGMWDYGSTASWTGAALASSALFRAAGTSTCHLSVYFFESKMKILFTVHSCTYVGIRILGADIFNFFPIRLMVLVLSKIYREILYHHTVLRHKEASSLGP